MSAWIIPCNLKYYDVNGAFAKLPRIDWKQSLKKVEVGDTVYIYVGTPVKAIRYKCLVNKVNLPAPEIDDSDYIRNGEAYLGYGNQMELELIRAYDAECLPLSKLREYGLKGNIQGPCSLPDCIVPLINFVEA